MIFMVFFIQSDKPDFQSRFPTSRDGDTQSWDFGIKNAAGMLESIPGLQSLGYSGYIHFPFGHTHDDDQAEFYFDLLTKTHKKLEKNY